MSSSGVRKGKPESTRFEPQQSANFQYLNHQNMLNNSPKPLIIAIKVIIYILLGSRYYSSRLEP